MPADFCADGQPGKKKAAVSWRRPPPALVCFYAFGNLCVCALDTCSH
jgi:hypothetical protein